MENIKEPLIPGQVDPLGPLLGSFDGEDQPTMRVQCAWNTLS